MINPFSLENKNIIITGASSGIGRECAVLCSKMGASVSIVGRNENRLLETLDLMEGEKNLYFSRDITQFNKIEDIVIETVNNLGQIDGFIHSAGVEYTLPLKLHTSEKLTHLFNVNFFSAIEFTKSLTKKKYCTPNGISCVYISSIMGRVSNAGLIGYSSTKGALEAAIKPLAIEFAKQKHRFNCVAPGYISNSGLASKKFTDITESSLIDIEKSHPLGFGSTMDIAAACVYLLSDGARWVTGTTLIVDGGYCTK